VWLSLNREVPEGSACDDLGRTRTMDSRQMESQMVGWGADNDTRIVMASSRHEENRFWCLRSWRYSNSHSFELPT
jgi:hypothetical protein